MAQTTAFMWQSPVIPSDNAQGAPDSMLRIAAYARVSTLTGNKTQRISFTNCASSTSTKLPRAGRPGYFS